eukprot:5472643-Alexandrium_andersonii.AAC.1
MPPMSWDPGLGSAALPPVASSRPRSRTPSRREIILWMSSSTSSSGRGEVQLVMRAARLFRGNASCSSVRAMGSL